MYNSDGGGGQPVGFFRPPDFCLGRHEKTEWTLDSWAMDQDALIYNRMTRLWSDLKRRFQVDPWQGEGPGGTRGKMAFMAVYNVDRFRPFVFESSFLKRYRIKPQVLKRIRTDDVALMKFGFEWVAFFIWGEQGAQIRLR